MLSRLVVRARPAVVLFPFWGEDFAVPAAVLSVSERFGCCLPNTFPAGAAGDAQTIGSRVNRPDPFSPQTVHSGK
jgi:hypothetical protein